MEWKQFSKGQKVKNQYGRILAVRYQDGCCVFVAEETGWYHPEKIWSMK